MEVRTSRASAVIIQRVPSSKKIWFEQWQKDVNQAAETFPGYLGADIYPPVDNSHDDWVVALHFEDDNSLRTWLESTVRAKWLEKLRTSIGDFDLKVLPGGFGRWFRSVMVTRDQLSLPSWKIALTVLLGLYPTVMILEILSGSYTTTLGFSIAMLFSNIITVSVLQWIVIPFLNKILAPWLKANSPEQNRRSLIGFLFIVAILTGLSLLFRQITG
ncbi:MAG: hypothetical protein PHS86_03395 [Syntrophaceae bacterium]|nr:hypothetical protein [Syntrophaceae bacterium]